VNWVLGADYPADNKDHDQVPRDRRGLLGSSNELNQRMAVERPRLILRIQEAVADDSNLAENSEYHAAQAGQLMNEARIVELEDKLARAEVIDVSKLSGDTIKFGATVTVIDADTDEKKVWRIVGEPEANANSGKISVNSPIGRALIGRAKGDAVEVVVPTGVRTYRVQKVEWL
jgi:transcription elongation factor GreA